MAHQAQGHHLSGEEALDALLRQRLHAREGQNHLAVVDAEGDAMSWQEVRCTTEHLGSGLDQLGVGREGTLALTVDNSAASVGALIAAVASGRRILPIPAHLPNAAVTNVIRDVRPSAWCVPRRPRTSDHAEVASVDAQPHGPVALPSDGSRLLALSSGTTGPPRPVPLHDAQLLTSLRATHRLDQAAHLRRPSLLAHPAAHIAGLWTILGAALSSSYLATLPRFEPGAWSRAVREHGTRGAFLVPTAIRDLLSSSATRSDLRTLALISTGAAPCPASWAEEFTDRFGVPVLSTYGATEFAGAVAGWDRRLHRDWWSTKRGSVGRPYPGIDLRVVDPGGRVLASDTSGRLEVRGAQTGSRRWVATSDAATIDRDGFLWIHGRLDRAIQRGGFTVIPEVVEDVLREYPGAVDALVYSRGDPRLGEIPCAKVEFAGPAPAKERVVAYCRERLAAYQVPAELTFGAITRSPTGKLTHAGSTRPD